MATLDAAALQKALDAAEAAMQRGDLDAAATVCRHASARWPDQPALLYNHGIVEYHRGLPAEAMALFRRVTRLAPDFAFAHHTLGQCHVKLQQLDEAVASFTEALRLDAGLLASRIALARVLTWLGRAADAVARLHETIDAHANDVDFCTTLGQALEAAGEAPAALASYRRAAELAPHSAIAQHNLSTTLHAQGETDAALPLAQRALELDPLFALGHENLGNILGYHGELDAARAAYARAGKLTHGSGPAPARPTGLDVRAALLLPPVPASVQEIASARERFAEGTQRLRRHGGVIVDPLREVGVVNQFYLAYHGQNNRELLTGLAAMHRALCPTLEYAAPHVADTTAADGRPVRVGIVSRYLRHHTIGRYLLGLVQQLARPEFTVVLCTWAHASDAMSDAFRRAADEYLLLPEALAPAREAIAAARLDVLLFGDIGMEPASYFLAFARLAPVQCAFYGHPDTTGIDTIDHFLSWAPAESAEAPGWYSERLTLLSGDVVYADLPRWPALPPALDKAALGLAADTPLVLCVQAVYKLHPDVDEIVAGVLTELPEARVAFVESRVAAWNARLRQRLAARLGALAARVMLLPERPYADYLALLQAADVILDTPHFSGGATTLDAIAVGTPVVTASGPTLRAMQSRALFVRLGVADGLAADHADAVRRLAALAGDRAHRAEVSGRILAARERLVGDHGMVREFEQMLRHWARR